MNYIHQPADPQARPPYTGENVLINGGFLKCSAPHLQRLCDLVLNRVNRDLHFSVVGDRVLYAALYAEKMRSANPEDAAFGYVSENDIGVWILTWGGRSGGVRLLRWMPAFIFVDSATALMTGRELYGYPKQMGRMIRNSVPDHDFTVDLKVISFATPGRDVPGEPLSVIAVQQTPGIASSPSKPAPGELLSGYGTMLREKPADLVENHGWLDALSELLPPFLGMPMVFLRQMRDVTAADAAQMQEISTVTVHPTKISALGFAPTQQVTLPPVASFPIAQTLGCAAKIDIEWPFWARFDFLVGLGERL